MPENAKKFVGQPKKKESQTKRNEFTIDLLAILNRRRGLVLASGVLGLVAAAAYFVLSPPKFESKAEVLLMSNDSAAMASQQSGSAVAVSEDLLATHMSIITSSRIVKAALLNNDLFELPSITDETDAPVKYVLDNLYVTKGGESSAKGAKVLSVAFRHTNPEDAQKIVTAVVAEYQSYVESKFQDINKEAVKLISEARESLEDGIKVVSDEYRDFMQDVPILADSGGPNIHIQSYEELASEKSNLLVKLDENRGRLELVQISLGELEKTDGPELRKLALIDAQNAQRLGVLVAVERGESTTAAFQALQPERQAEANVEYSSLLAQRSRLKQLTEELGAKHPEVRALRMQVEGTESFIADKEELLQVDQDEKPLTPDDVMAAYISLLTHDISAIERRLADIDSQMLVAETAAKELIDFELQQEEYLRELTRSEDLYATVIERLRDINMKSDSKTLIHDTIEEPALGRQVSPNLPIAAALGILTTMMLAGASILVAELCDKTVHTPEDLENIYRSRILSHIADFETDADSRHAVKVAARSGSPIAPTMFSVHSPKSQMAEAFRGLRTQLMFSLRGDKRVLAITSPKEGDGKSTITSNLAVSLANTGKSVLLVDCDMRRPNVHRIFGLENSKGLAEVLTGEVEMLDVANQGTVQGMTILSAGNIPGNPAELLSSDSFSQLVDSVREKFDFVVLDCPPLLPVSDPSIIAPIADHVLLVTSLDADEVPQAEECNRLLDSVDANLVGIVVNRVSRPNSTYQYSTYSNGYYKSQYQTA